MHQLRFQLGQLAAGGGGGRSKAVEGGGLLPWLRARQGHSLLALGVLGMVGGCLRKGGRAMM